MMLNKVEIRPNKPRDGRHCDLCGCSQPAVRCDKCGCQIFCLSCDDMYHRHPKRRFHLRKAVDTTPPIPQARPVLPMKVAHLSTSPGDPSKMPLPPPRKKKPGKSFFDTFRRASPSSDNSPPLPKKEYSWTDRLGSIKKFMSNRPLPPLPNNSEENHEDLSGQSLKHDLSFIHKRVEEKPPQLPQRNFKPPQELPGNHSDKENQMRHFHVQNNQEARNGTLPGMLPQNGNFNTSEENHWSSNKFPQQLNTLNRQNYPGYPLQGRPGYSPNFSQPLHQSVSSTDLQSLPGMDGHPASGMPPHYPPYPMNAPLPPHYPYPMYPQYPNYPPYFGNSFANLSSQPTTENDFSDHSEASSRHQPGKRYPFRKKAKRSQSVMVDRMGYPGQYFPFGAYPPGYAPPPWGPPFQMDTPPSPASSIRSLNRIGRTRHRKKMTSEDDEEEFSVSSSPLSRPKSSSSERPIQGFRKVPPPQRMSSSDESEEEREKTRTKRTSRKDSDPKRLPSPAARSPQVNKKKVSKSKRAEVFQASDTEDVDQNQVKVNQVKVEIPKISTPDQTQLSRSNSIPSNDWQCKHCTYLNPSGNKICQVCCKTASPVDDTLLASSRPTSSSSRKLSFSSEKSCSSPEKKMDGDIEDLRSQQDKRDMDTLNTALDEAEKEISRGLEELMKLKEDFSQQQNSIKKEPSSSQKPPIAKDSTDTSKPVYKSSGKMRTSILDKLNFPTTEPPTKSTSTETQTGNAERTDRIIEARRPSTSSTTSDAYNSPVAQSPDLDRVSDTVKNVNKKGQQRDSSCQTQEDNLLDYIERKTAEEENFFGRPNNGYGYRFGERMDAVTSPVPSKYDRLFGGGFGMMPRSHSRASLFAGRMNDPCPMDYGFGQSPMYRSVSRSSLTGDFGDARFSEFHNLRKPDFYLSMEELVERRRQEQIRAQGLELVRMIREAEQQGFAADDIQIALSKCGKQNPLEWLHENWRDMVENVVNMSTNYGNEKKENDIGAVSENEAREALRLHKGNVWAAVTECVESRQRKFFELKARGKFSSKAITEALTAVQGDVGLAYDRLTKTTSKPFLMRIWGTGEGAENQDGANMPSMKFKSEEELYRRREENEYDVLSDDIWSEDDDVEWEEDPEEDEEHEQGDLEDLQTCHDDLPNDIITPESDKSDYCDAYGANTLDRMASLPSDEESVIALDTKVEKKRSGLLSKIAALKKDEKLTSLKFYDGESADSNQSTNLQELNTQQDQAKSYTPFNIIKSTITAIRDTVSGSPKTEKKLPCVSPEKRTIIVNSDIDQKHANEKCETSHSPLLSSTESKTEALRIESLKSNTEANVNKKESFDTQNLKKSVIDQKSKSTDNVKPLPQNIESTSINTKVVRDSQPNGELHDVQMQNSETQSLKQNTMELPPQNLERDKINSNVEEKLESFVESDDNKTQNVIMQSFEQDMIAQNSKADNDKKLLNKYIEKEKTNSSAGVLPASLEKNIPRSKPKNINQIVNELGKSPNIVEPTTSKSDFDKSKTDEMKLEANQTFKNEKDVLQKSSLDKIKENVIIQNFDNLFGTSEKNSNEASVTQNVKGINETSPISDLNIKKCTKNDVSPSLEKEDTSIKSNNKNVLTQVKTEVKESRIQHNETKTENIVDEEKTSNHTIKEKFSTDEKNVLDKPINVHKTQIPKYDINGQIENLKYIDSNESIEEVATVKIFPKKQLEAIERVQSPLPFEETLIDYKDNSSKNKTENIQSFTSNTNLIKEKISKDIKNSTEFSSPHIDEKSSNVQAPLPLEISSNSTEIKAGQIKKVTSLSTDIDLKILNKDEKMADGKIVSLKNKKISSLEEEVKLQTDSGKPKDIIVKSDSVLPLPSTSNQSVDEKLPLNMISEFRDDQRVLEDSENKNSKAVNNVVDCAQIENNNLNKIPLIDNVCYEKEDTVKSVNQAQIENTDETLLSDKRVNRASKESEIVSSEIQKQSVSNKKDIPAEDGEECKENLVKISSVPVNKTESTDVASQILSNQTIENPQTLEMAGNQDVSVSSNIHSDKKILSDTEPNNKHMLKNQTLNSLELAQLNTSPELNTANNTVVDQNSDILSLEIKSETELTPTVSNIETNTSTEVSVETNVDDNSKRTVDSVVKVESGVSATSSISDLKLKQEGIKTSDSHIPKTQEVIPEPTSSNSSQISADTKPFEISEQLAVAGPSTYQSTVENKLEDSSKNSSSGQDSLSTEQNLTKDKQNKKHGILKKTPSVEGHVQNKVSFKSADTEIPIDIPSPESMFEDLNSAEAKTDDVEEDADNSENTTDDTSYSSSTDVSSSSSRRSSITAPSPVDALRNRFEGLIENGSTVVRPHSPMRRMSFNSRKAAIALERTRESSVDKTWQLPKAKTEPSKPIVKRTLKQQMEIERKVRKIVADRKCRTYKKAEIVVQLMEMNFEEEEALQAANECSTLEQAISYLQQECLLCTGYFPVSHIISMVHCPHKACRECIRAYFTVQIRDRNIMELLCPFCNEPDLTDEDIAQDYFNHLDIMLKKLVEEEIHELFQRKLRDRVLMRDPSFRWCSKCSSGFLAMPNMKRLVCPDCNAVTCASCRRPWEKEHQGISCEAFAALKDAEDPETQAASLAKLLTEDGIDCPRCHFRYALAKGGCMHFRCIQCQHDFCSGCSKPFKMGQKCGVSEFCGKLGLHAHHPRNCLFYLRDKEPEDLQRLLDMSDLKYNTDPPDNFDSKNTCPVMEQKETADGMVDDYCSKDVEKGFAGLCRIHYVEYLGQLVNKHKVDPIQIFEQDDLELVLRRANIRLPPKRYRETDDQYKEKLVNLIQEELPLDKMEGS